TSDSATRLTVWPYSEATSSAVSASITSLTVAIWPFFIRTLMTSTERRAMRLASSATVMVSGMVTSRGPAGPAGAAWTAVFANLLGRGRRLGGSLGALLGGGFFLFLFERAAGTGGRGRHAAGGRGLFLLLAARDFFFGVTAGFRLGGLARVLFRLAALGGGALDLQPLVFAGAQARLVFGALARLDLMDAGIGERRTAARLFLFGQLAQHDATRR